MKKLILLLVLLVGLSNKLNAQMAVTDAGATAVATETKVTASTTLTKTVAMLDQITNMRQKYDSMMENIEVVSDAISTGKQIINITQTLGKINNNYQKAIDYINNEDIIHPVEKAKYLNAFTKVVGECIDDMDDAYQLSTSGSYKMTDAERMSLLKEIQKNLNDQNSFILYFLQKIKKGVSTVKQKKSDSDFIINANQSFKN